MVTVDRLGEVVEVLRSDARITVFVGVILLGLVGLALLADLLVPVQTVETRGEVKQHA